MKLKQGGRDFPEHTQYFNGFPERRGKRQKEITPQESLCQ